MNDMYKPIPFSPVALLASDIAAGATIIPVSDITAFPAPPSYATIGDDANAETIIYTAITGNSLSGCVRGVEGTAKAWSSGEHIARNFTAADHQALINNLLEVAAGLSQAYSPTNKPTATDIGAVRITPYGIVNDYKDLPFGFSHFVYAGNKLNDPFTSTGAKRIHCLTMKRLDGDTGKVIFATSVDAGNVGEFYIGYDDGNTLKWYGLLSQRGGALSGQLTISKGEGETIVNVDGGGNIHSISISHVDGNYAITRYGIAKNGDYTNMTNLLLRYNDAVSSHDTTNTTLRIENRVNGVSTYYNIFGEHNKGLLTESLKSLPKNTVFTANDIYYYKNADGTCYVSGNPDLVSSSIADFTTIGTLPAGYRPSTVIPFTAVDFQQKTGMLGYVDSSGTIKIRTLGSATGTHTSYFNFSFKTV